MDRREVLKNSLGLVTFLQIGVAPPTQELLGADLGVSNKPADLSQEAFDEWFKANASKPLVKEEPLFEDDFFDKIDLLTQKTDQVLKEVKDISSAFEAIYKLDKEGKEMIEANISPSKKEEALVKWRGYICWAEDIVKTHFVD